MVIDSFIPIAINQVKYISHSLFQESKEVIMDHSFWQHKFLENRSYCPYAFSVKYVYLTENQRLIKFFHFLTLSKTHITKYFKRYIEKGSC